MRKKQIDIIDLLIVGVMIASLVVSLQYYFNIQNNECVRDPLIYGIKYYEDKFQHKFIGNLVMIRESGNPFIIYYDNTSINLTYIPDK